ncbi:hypothetical protein DFH29DRAFT_1017819 [Suillus ampliporus]|nr:hypothetical protein DFH29DRAFT_1017819 [Suillus ampliporus]
MVNQWVHTGTVQIVGTNHLLILTCLPTILQLLASLTIRVTLGVCVRTGHQPCIEAIRRNTRQIGTVLHTILACGDSNTSGRSDRLTSETAHPLLSEAKKILADGSGAGDAEESMIWLTRTRGAALGSDPDSTVFSQVLSSWVVHPATALLKYHPQGTYLSFHSLLAEEEGQ